MPYQIKINQPNLAEGTELTILGLGTFENGKTYDISDEQVEAFREANQVDAGGFDNDPESESFGVYVPNMQPGPHLTDVSIHGVEVTEAAGKKAKSPSKGPVAGTSESGAPADKGGDS